MSAVEIAGRYRLESRLGFGGMSTVHLAFDRRLERRVAVKLLAEHLAEDPTFVSRFQREAQAAARLVHPNIVQVFDSGLDERTGQHFIVMEYIEGQSCAEILRDEGWVEVPEAASIVEQACAGLDYAHRNGVVHRDVKPGNLLRSHESGDVKLADFGIAKATEQSSITQVGSVLGTAAYLAPEQARGEEAGPSADLYALGVVTYQLISGRLPYEAASLTELALKQQREEPPMLDTLVAAVGPELAEAVAIALALDPRDRYRTAREMGRAVGDAQRGIPPVEPGVEPRQGRHSTEATTVLAASARGEERTVVARGAAAGAAAPRRPRPGPAPRRAEPLPTAAAGRQTRGRLKRRIFGALFALLLIAVAVGVVVLVTAPTPTRITLRNVVYQDVEKSANELRELVAENTR
ncbi:MAG TPA: protein kinase [Solirubrobacteraceae bacterium]|nr:protein kinase [Solirubrobacteraceae bacterium]